MTTSPPLRAATVLVVDDEPDMRWVLAGALTAAGHRAIEAADGADALTAITTGDIDVVLSDVRMPNVDGMELLRRVQDEDHDLPVILLSAVEDVATAVDAMKLGAYDWFAKPFSTDRLIAAIERAAEQRRLRLEVDTLRRQLPSDRPFFGNSTAAHDLDRTLDLLADQPRLAVLLCGESGTGKEVVAREIHRRSGTRGSFVAIDCGALPETLMESHLFGHRKGAFTGADRDAEGLFRTAHGGTLFLDELGNLPLGLQAKLLRALQERTVVPVGGGQPVSFEARLICATNVDLGDQVEAGLFRIDLFHRVAEFVQRLPPLRERPEDIDEFATRFCREANAEMGRAVVRIAPAALEQLRNHAWAGNLRELRNVIRRGVLLSAGGELTHLELPRTPTDASPSKPTPRPDRLDELEPPAEDGSLTDRVRAAATAIEYEILARTLAATDNNKAAAARSLQIDYTTLHRKLKKHGLIDRPPPPTDPLH